MQSGSKFFFFFLTLKQNSLTLWASIHFLCQIEVIIFPTFGGCHFNHLLCTRKKVAMLIWQEVRMGPLLLRALPSNVSRAGNPSPGEQLGL